MEVLKENQKMQELHGKCGGNKRRKTKLASKTILSKITSKQFCIYLNKGYAKPSVNCTYEDNQTPLHLACLYEDHKIIKLLVEHHANINACNKNHRTPLHFVSQFVDDLFSSSRGSTIENENLALVKFLIEKGANPSIRDKDGKFPYELAKDESIKAYLESITDKSVKNTNERATFAMHTKLYEDYKAEVEMKKELEKTFEIQINNKRQAQRLKDQEELKRKAEEKQRKLDEFFKENLVEVQYEVPEDEVKPSLSPYEKHKLKPTSFEIMHPLGAGAFGQVWLVKNKNNNDIMAMKVIDKLRLIKDELMPYANTEKLIMLEIQHPFIITLKHSFQTPDKFFLLMEYCCGGDLAAMIGKNQTLSEDMARNYIAEIILAIETIHKANIAYRDLKPANVLINEDGHCKLTDFGLSKDNLRNGQMTYSFCGSVAYMAPEVLRREGYDKSVDWYLIGVCLYEMLFGEPPFYNDDSTKMHDDIINAKLKIPDGISKNCKDLLKKLLEKNPKKRFGCGKKGSDEIKAHKFF